MKREKLVRKTSSNWPVKASRAMLENGKIVRIVTCNIGTGNHACGMLAAAIGKIFLGLNCYRAYFHSTKLPLSL